MIPFQIVGDRSGRWYNERTRYRRTGRGPMLIAWRPPSRHHVPVQHGEQWVWQNAALRGGEAVPSNGVVRLCIKCGSAPKHGTDRAGLHEMRCACGNHVALHQAEARAVEVWNWSNASVRGGAAAPYPARSVGQEVDHG
jgi:hypothetical protein